MKDHLFSIVAGLLFGLGLGLSQMIDPARVLGFLDITGAWDPTLMFVLGGAVGVTAISFRFVLKKPGPLLGGTFNLPPTTLIDRPLLLGSAIFGIGWGIAGYCPGPGITGIMLGAWNPLLFVAAFALGSILARRF